MRVVRVLELGGVAAGYCGRLFVNGGAQVVRYEVAAADDGTDRASNAPAAQSQAVDIYLHGGKTRKQIDLRNATGVAQLLEDMRAADIVVAALPAAELDRLQWQRWPAPVRVAITPFGLTGPYRDWQATGSVLLAMGGYTKLIGDPSRAPLCMPGHYAEYQSGQYAYIAALASFDALHADADTDAKGEAEARAGARRTIDVSMLETVLSLSQITTIMWTFCGELRSRHGNDWQNLYPLSLYRCRDGWFSVNIVPTFWQAFTKMLGRPELFDDPRFATNDGRMANKQALAQIIEDALGQRTMSELLELGQRHSRVPTGIVLDVGEVLNDAHLAARNFWQTRKLDDGRVVKVPAVPFRYVRTRRGERAPERRRVACSSVVGPLNGVRIADFTHVWAGPLGSRILADLGAEVIKIEAPFARGPRALLPSVAGIYPGGIPGAAHWNRQGVTNKLNRNKKGLAVNLKDPRGAQLVAELISQCDVVIDNFSARAMQTMGFGFDALAALNPAIIHVAMPGYGLSGPYSDFVAFGPSVEPMSGLTSLMGYSDAEPRTTALALPDAIAGVTAAAAVVAALHRRRVEGITGLLELSLHEGAIAMFGEFFVERQLTGKQPRRLVNRHRDNAPHGIYPCAGEDEWIAIACTSDNVWRALVQVLGLPDEPAWRTHAGRREQQDAVDVALAAATQGRQRFTLMQQLQAAGVPAGVLTTTPDVLVDPQVVARRFFVPLGAEHIATVPYPGIPVRIDDERAQGWFAAPCLGEHNAEVVLHILGRSRQDLQTLQADAVLVDRPSV